MKHKKKQSVGGIDTWNCITEMDVKFPPMKIFKNISLSVMDGCHSDCRRDRFVSMDQSSPPTPAHRTTK